MKEQCKQAVAKALGKQSLSAQEATDIEARINETMRNLARKDIDKWRNLSDAEKLTEASKQVAIDIQEQLKRKHKIAAQDILKQSQNIAALDHGKLSSMEVIDRMVAAHGDMSGIQSIDSKARGIAAIYRGELVDFYTNIKGGLGVFTDKELVNKIVRERFGDNTGDPLAKKISDKMGDVFETMRERFNRNGGDIGKLDNWGLPQTHNLEKIAKAGKEAWVAKGILSGVTGHRAHFIQNDDVETPKTTGSPEAREKLTYRLSEQTHIAFPGAKKLWIGTPHSHDSLYDKIKKLRKVDILVLKMFENEKRIENALAGSKYLLDFEPIHAFAGIGQGAKYLSKGQDYTLKKANDLYEVTFANDHYVADFYSEGIWADRFDAEEMASRREECKTLNEWDSQYQMHAKPIGDVRLDPDKIIAYNCEPVLKRANRTTMFMIGERQIVGATFRWDPSSGKLKSDVSSTALVFHDDIGNKYWHRSIALKGEVIETDADGRVVGGQVWQLCNIIKDFHLSKVTIETNGIGNFAPAALKAALKTRGIRCGVTEQHSTKSKNKRILDGIEGPLISGLLWAHVSVLEDENGEDSAQVKQMREFNPAITDQPDDYLDSLSGAIVEAPERVGKSLNQTDYEESPNWRTNGGVHEAALEFDD